MEMTPTSPTSDREILTTRIFNAPRELVFKVWTDPKHIDKWWGPRGFSNETHHMDVRPGGKWRFTMHSTEYGNFANHVAYLEVVPNERLVYDQGDVPENAPQFRVTVTFEDEGEKTRLTMRMVFPTPAARDMVVENFGALDGQKQTLDRLEAHLEGLINA